MSPPGPETERLVANIREGRLDEDSSSARRRCVGGHSGGQSARPRPPHNLPAQTAPVRGAGPRDRTDYRSLLARPRCAADRP